MILPRSWYARATITVAKELLGKYLIHQTKEGLLVGQIIETEAYLGADDAAAHSYKGVTPRTQALFNQPGTIYIYLIYGLHYCLNIVTGIKGKGHAVLIRAIKPITGQEQMQENRQLSSEINLANGPAKLVQAFDISFSQNGDDITRGPLTIQDEWNGTIAPAVDEVQIVITPRIGITKAAHLPLRFLLHIDQLK